MSDTTDRPGESPQSGGMWLPKEESWAEIFGRKDSAESRLLTVMMKAPTCTLREVSDLAESMGLVVKFQVQPKGGDQ